MFAGIRGGPMVGVARCKGQCPLPKKILYLMDIRYIVSFPTVVGNCSQQIIEKKKKKKKKKNMVKGGGDMGPLLVLVSPCFRENVVVTCKIGSFLCSLDNSLQKNVIVFFFGNQISKWHSFEKRANIYDLLFTFFSHQGKVTKIPSAHISLTYIHVFYSLC